MLTFEQRKAAFADLGHHIGSFIDRQSLRPSKDQQEFERVITLARAENQWFTEENICFALQEWSKALQKDTLEEWLVPYNLEDNPNEKNIGVIMAGNIPLVGFHDFLSVLISGHSVLAKLSSNDKTLLPYLAEKLIDIQPEFQSKINFIDQRLTGFDAVIATGSNNTARYFEYYFRDKPHIIRKNRNGVAILTGNETDEEIQSLGEDIFRYFGLGCRNVSKIFMPEDFELSRLFEGLKGFESYIHHNKYANNYDYNKAVYLMSEIKFHDNGFLMLKEDEGYASPIGVINYERYNKEYELKQKINQEKNNIQCTIGKHKLCNFEFGKAQTPGLSDYADGVDTINFLKNLD